MTKYPCSVSLYNVGILKLPGLVWVLLQSRDDVVLPLSRVSRRCRACIESTSQRTSAGVSSTVAVWQTVAICLCSSAFVSVGSGSERALTRTEMHENGSKWRKKRSWHGEVLTESLNIVIIQTTWRYGLKILKTDWSPSSRRDQHCTTYQKNIIPTERSKQISGERLKVNLNYPVRFSFRP